jgi:hypothetical protein
MQPCGYVWLALLCRLGKDHQFNPTEMQVRESLKAYDRTDSETGPNGMAKLYCCLCPDMSMLLRFLFIYAVCSRVAETSNNCICRPQNSKVVKWHVALGSPYEISKNILDLLQNPASQLIDCQRLHSGRELHSKSSHTRRRRYVRH